MMAMRGDQMTIQEVIQGESKNVEFKEKLPTDSVRYTKTVVAYANTQGGKIIFGVADKTREIVGIGDDILFQTMDSIANAVSDSCEPQIIPDIEPYTIEGKTVIIVTVSPSPARPYYLKSMGKESGTYIRVGATSRPASPDKIKELEMEGAKISWDELTCVGYKVTEKAIKTLCHDMNVRRKEMQERKELAEKLPTVTRTNLVNWKVLKETSDGYLASNAFVLLTSDYFQFSKTQCAVFKGTDRVVFLDKREYTGPIYNQVEEAVNFVLRNIRLEAKIDGLIRKESYELPVDAIREMIVNAHCHRNLTDESCVQVAIYDDRLEVSSPGGLYNGLTFEDAMSGHSKLRNRAIANVFRQIGFIEAWGSGIRRIRDAAKEYDLPEPEFIETPGMFRVNLYRKALPMQGIGQTSVKHRSNIGDESVEHRSNIGDESVEHRSNNADKSVEHRINQDTELSVTQLKILDILSTASTITSSELAKQVGISKRNIEVNIKKLRERGLIIRHGSSKGGYWEVVEK